MSDTTLVSAEQLTQIVEKVVASRGFDRANQQTAGHRATAILQPYAGVIRP